MDFMSGPEPQQNTVTRLRIQTLPESVIAIYPMTRTQEGLWTDYSFAPHRTHNNLTLKLTVTHGDESYDGSLGAIHTAIGTLTRRHAILRSTFHEPNGFQNRPFVAEHDPSTAASTLHIIPAAKTKQAAANLLKMLRCGVDLSTHFAMRWIAVISAKETEVYVVSHHIALDGSSMSQLSVDFFDILAQLKNGEGASAPQTLQFSHAHIYEAAFMASAEFEDASRFWLGQLTNAKAIQWKAANSSTSKATTYRSIQTWMDFPKADLGAWGNRFKTSWFRVAVATIGLLTRINSEPDHGSDQNVWVAFGGRPAGFENVLGQFANALPIRIPYSDLLQNNAPGAPVRFEDLVRLVSKQVSAAKKHERMAIMDISKATNTRGAFVNRAQVAVTLSPKLSRGDASLYPVEGPYDLFFCFLEAETSVSLGVIYDPRLFTEGEMNGLKTQFFEIQKATNLESSLDITSVSGALVPRIYPEVDYTDLEAISACRMHVWFEEQAARNPELVALHWGERKQSVTYKVLNQSANQIAHYLRSLGIGRGMIIVLHIGRNFATMEWILAVLKSGAAYAIVDQSHPVERSRAAISVAEPSFIVDDGGSPKSKELFEGFEGKVIFTNDINLSGMPSHNLTDESEDDDLAYIVFTSGSTGKPKGVEIEHRNLSHFVADSFASKYVDLGPGSRVLQFATFSFDAAVLEWAQCLTVGATLCFVDTPKALVGDYLADVIDANEVTFMHVTPSVLATLPTSRALPSLRQISVGGEMVPANLINTWRSRVHVQNAYGPTETTVVMAHQPQPKDREAEQPSSSIIGAPHSHTKFYISNETYDRILPIGELGEVCIGGPQVGRGYKGQAELTAARFAIHPEVGERLYRTGDRGKLLANGAISLVGRIDREVKVRGYRIELEAVERMISSLGDDIECVSVQVNTAGTGLCAFISPQRIDGDFVRAGVAKRLPDYMVPSAIYTLPRLPLNTNDKVDHKAIKSQMETLIAQYGKGKGASARSAPLAAARVSTPPHPATVRSKATTEGIIGQIWQDLLGLSSRPASDTNFFELGGNSLLATKLADELRQKFPSSSIRVVELYSQATVKHQVELVDGSRAIPQDSTVEVSSIPSDPEPAYTVPTSGSSGTLSAVTHKLTEIWQNILGVKNITTQVNFFDAGGHSLAVSRLLHEIREAWPTVDVKLVDLFHKSTITSQAALILPSLPVETRPEQLPEHFPQQPPVQVHTHEVVDSGSEIAIIGLSGRFPGADSPDELYQLLLDRREGFTTFPTPSKLPFKDAIFIPRKGAIANVEDFDHSFWGLKEGEARDMDPQTRLFMETTLEALEDAGHVPSSDGHNKIGLCVGAATNTWLHATEAVSGDDFYKTHREVLTPSVSARTAYHLNLHGPNVTLNTACSSGMVALSLAVDHLRSGQCDISVAGGVSISFPQGGYITQERQIFSTSGHCRPFDHRADGTLPADGVCAVVLRKLSDAVRDGDRIYSVISGVAIGSDGHTDKAGYSVPSPRGQAELIKRAWKNSGLDPRDLTYAELHGSGTSIGDALELEALNLGLSAGGAQRPSCVVGSNKGNLGNCEAASGLVSLIKLCKSIQHDLVPPVQSFERISPMINPSLPFKIAAAPTRLSEDAILSVSSAGLGGVNAHCIIRYPPPLSRRPLDGLLPSRRTNVKRLDAPARVEQGVVVGGGFVDKARAIALCASRLLSVDVDEDTDLRNAGLDSNTQVRLVRMILDLFGPPSLGVTAFMQPTCTPRTLSASLVEDAAVAPTLPPYASVLQHGNDTVYVLLAPGGGSCASFADLIDALPRSVTILGLEHPNYVRPTSRQYSVDDLSELYINALKQYPGAIKECVLVGASFGGVVAVELATQLPQHGFKVSSIALLDTPWPGSLPSGAFSVNGFLRDVYGIIMRSRELDYPTPNQSPPRPSTPSSYKSLPDCGDGSNGGCATFESMAVPFDAASFEAFLASAAVAGGDSSEAFRRVQKSDWRTLSAVYADNICALERHSVDDVRLDVPALYIHAAVDGLDRHALAPWSDVFSRLFVKHIDAPHASVYTGENAKAVVASMARIVS